MRDALIADPESVLDEKHGALLAYARQLTRDPANCRETDVAALRAIGASDAEIHATVQVASYFNYINRVADALGVDLEEEMVD